MESTLIPHVNDVLFGRGTAINVHPGNRQFRSFVDSHKDNFLKAQSNKDRNAKRSIALLIFSSIQSMQPPGRFLVEVRSEKATESNTDNNNSSLSSSTVHPTLEKKTWKCVDRDKALDKILKRLRERGNEEMAVSLPLTQIREVERGVFHSHSIMLPKPQTVEVKIGTTCQFNAYYHNRWGNQTVDAFGLPSQLNHQWQHSNSNSLHLNTTSTNRELSSEARSIRDRAATETASKNGSALCQYLEGSGLDFIDDILLQATTPQVDQDFIQHVLEYTLRQWIVASNPFISFDSATSIPSSSERTQYITSALLIALKLTECFLEAEKDERNGHGNPIPLASIAPENVLLRSRRGRQHAVFGESNEAQETIEFVWVMSLVGDDPATGTAMARLFAVGKILYELFSMKEFVMDKDELPAFHTVSMDSINISNTSEDDYRPQKRSHWTDEGISNCIARLESNGVSWSLCALVKNLLECRHGSLCEDDAYASFDDLHVDLQLMVNNPSCFLDNIHISDNPKLAIPDKLYGREEKLSKLDTLFKRHIVGRKLNGTIISGEAGVGKSKLAMHLQELTNQSNGYFLSAKFEQHQMSLKPMSIIASLFDSLCEMLFEDSSRLLLTKIEGELTSALRSQPSLLGVVPRLRKLMPSCLGIETSASSNCVDSGVSTRYLLGELLRVISSNSKPITIVLDDIQFADHASLLLVGNMLCSAQGTPTFFTLCHRDDDISMSDSFKAWLTSITMFALEPIKMESITIWGVNNLISEALHLSPRLTRPLSSALYRKTRGNPLFVRQLLDSLTEQGYIYIDMKQHRWAWDLEKIIELEISESVLVLLTNDIQRLPSDLQFGLQVAACIGSCVTDSMLNYLSIGLGLDLKNILQQASQKGFMIDVAGTSLMFRFAHDKIREAAYELIPERQRRENHMRFGLALFTQTLDNLVEDEELYFAAVNQINQGGPTAVHDPSQKNVFAQLNLKAGRRSIELSDYNTAFRLFQHGISFLGDDDWALNYQLSLDLYDAAAEASVVLNKVSEVTFYTDVVVMHARCFDDKLLCLCTAAKALGIANRLDDSIDASLGILLQFGEKLPRVMGTAKLTAEMDQMKKILQSLSDDVICKTQDGDDTKRNSLIGLYAYLIHVAHFRRPWLVGSLSLRMVELAISPCALAYFGGVLVTAGCINEGCRLGKLALKLVERRGSLQYKSRVIYFVYNTVLWASEPVQMLVERHLLGYTAGQQSGDVSYSISNAHAILHIDYITGRSFDVVQKNILDFMSKLEIHGSKLFYKYPILLLSQIMVLKEGLHMAGVVHVKNFPDEDGILTDGTPSVLVLGRVFHLSRAFFFRKMDEASRNIDISEAVAETYRQLTPFYLFGYFFEGLASFQLARQTSDRIESANWIERGQSVLAKMRCLSDHSLWNWENKMLLLEAESMHTKGEFDRAGSFYDNAIRSAHEHRFIHEEAIASELAGIFYYERGIRQKSYKCLVHSVECYEKWGAHAVARRVETDIRDYFGTDVNHVVSSAGDDTSLEDVLSSSQGYEKKRQHRE